MNTGYKYYSLKSILKRDAQYNIIIGERSNGKTYAVQNYALKNYCNGKGSLALIRRWKEDFRNKRGSNMFNALVQNGLVDKYTNGEFNDIMYRSMQWWLCKRDDTGEITLLDNEPFCYGFSLSDMEHDKSVSFPTVTTICFDEFLTRGMYINDEFVIFMNALSTIIRQRTNVKIFMLGNTVNKYCPYFSEFGLSHIKQMKKGTIDVYKYGDSKLKVAVEYCDTAKRNSKPSDIYFAFNNPRLDMIKSGDWEVDIYAHLPYKYKPKDVKFLFFIVFNGETIQCEIIYKHTTLFLYCHMKTTDLKYKQTDIIYDLNHHPEPNRRTSFVHPMDNIDNKISRMFRMGKVFYQNNEVGEIVNNFLKTSKGI